MMEIHNCEQGTEEWLALRAGRPTASEFDKIITGTGKRSSQITGYAARLAAELYAGGPLDRWEGNAATQRGHENEPVARASYEFDNGVQTVQVGFITNFGAGCSPDSLVGDDGLLEIKSQVCGGHVETFAFWIRNGRCPAGYIPQVQGQLWVCERAWADLWFHHPRLPSLAIRIERDEEYIETLRQGIKEVLAERDELVSMLRRAA